MDDVNDEDDDMDDDMDGDVDELTSAVRSPGRL